MHSCCLQKTKLIAMISIFTRIKGDMGAKGLINFFLEKGIKESKNGNLAKPK